MTDQPNMLQHIHEQLQREIAGDAEAVTSALRSEFQSGTTELTGHEATVYLQETWLQGKGLRNVEEIDRIGAEKWWEQVFEHIGTDITPAGKKIFMSAIENGIDFVDAMHFATVLGEMAPPEPPAPAPMPVQPPIPPTPAPMPPPPGMEMPPIPAPAAPPVMSPPPLGVP